MTVSPTARWARLFPGTNVSLLHVTTCSDALHDLGWTGRHFVSSGNASAPEQWSEAASNQSPAATGRWRMSTSCVPLHSRAGLPQLRCMGYDLHCKPEAAPCAASTTAFINTTLFTLHPAQHSAGAKPVQHVTASDGGLATFTGFPKPLLTNRALKGGSCGDGADCAAYSYAAYPGVGLAHQLRTGGFLQLVGASMTEAASNHSYSMFAMVSKDGSIWKPRAVVPEGSCTELSENDWVYQSDNTTLFAVFRNAGPAETLCASRSTTEGRVWSTAAVLALPNPSNVLPRLACLMNGLLTLSTGRIGLFLYTSANNGTSWHSLDVALNHNVLSSSVSDRYSEAFVRGAGDSTMSTSYTSLVAYEGTNTVQVCYDRLANGWDKAPGSYGNSTAIFCSKMSLTAK